MDSTKKTATCSTDAAKIYKQRHDRGEAKPFKSMTQEKPTMDMGEKKKSKKDPVPKLY